MSSESIAELYKAGTSFREISTSLGIHPDAARTRYNEIRARRGLTRRGRWHQVLLDAPCSGLGVLRDPRRCAIVFFWALVM